MTATAHRRQIARLFKGRHKYGFSHSAARFDIARLVPIVRAIESGAVHRETLRRRALAIFNA
jgi:hypothetical protein